MRTLRSCRGWGWALAGGLCLAAHAARAQPHVKAVPPDHSGFAKLLCASPYGGSGLDEIVGAAVLPDGQIVLAGNRGLTDPKKGRGKGFLLFLTVSGAGVSTGKPVALTGHVRRLKAAGGGRLAVLVDSAGVFLLKPGSRRPVRSCQRSDVDDFGVDGSGELVILHGRRMTRYDRTWQRTRWTVSWHAHGGNRPGGLAVCPKTGIAAVVGYGMTHTGREPWKDPYAYGFDRAGKQRWKLWDPPPGKQVASSHGGNGLMADTTGHLAAAGCAGKLYLGLFADGGNSVCTRDPADPDRPIEPDVFAGVYQRGPGHGFKGASKTSVAFRVEPVAGRLEKGTWMCAWLNPGRANGLGMDDLADDEAGRVYVVGGSAYGCPTKKPWYYDETAYRGGGFLAILDKDFRMVQCGFFQQTSMRCVAAGSGYLVIGGTAKVNPKDADHPLQVHNPIQKDLAGPADGYFAVFETGPHEARAPAAPGPAADTAAARLLREAEQAARQGKRDLARAKLKYVTLVYAAAPEAARARELLKQLAAAPAAPDARPPASPMKPPAGKQPPKPADPERQAERLLQKAENYLANKMNALAKKTLRRIVREYPKTEVCKHARRLLEAHFPDE